MNVWHHEYILGRQNQRIRPSFRSSLLPTGRECRTSDGTAPNCANYGRKTALSSDVYVTYAEADKIAKTNSARQLEAPIGNLQLSEVCIASDNPVDWDSARINFGWWFRPANRSCRMARASRKNNQTSCTHHCGDQCQRASRTAATARIWRAV